MTSTPHGTPFHRLASAVILATAVATGAIATPSTAAGHITLWDTGRPAGNPGTPSRRETWKEVPSDLMTLEANPPKAASDPGYYGRPYTFRGNPVIETHTVRVTLSPATGSVDIHSGTNSSSIPTSATPIATLRPLGGATHATRIGIVRNSADEVILEAVFTGGPDGDAACVFRLGRDGILDVQPGGRNRGIALTSRLAHAIIPSTIGDDLIVGARECRPGITLHLPGEHALLGLIDGRTDQWMLTWPARPASIAIQTPDDTSPTGPVRRVEVSVPSGWIHLQLAHAAGLWHEERLGATHLEKDSPLGWKPPFPARWKTQLMEAGVRTSFVLKSGPAEIWRGVPGSYPYPAWFDGNTTFLRLGKKIPPRGEALFYCIEPQNTPPTITTPADVLRATLGRDLADSILDAPGRRLRSHHRRSDGNVHRACTCGFTEAIQAVFEEGTEVQQRAFIEEALADMTHFVKAHLDRIDEYLAFARKTSAYLKQRSGEEPRLRDYCGSLDELLQQIPGEYEVQKENMKSLEHAAELSRRTLALTARHETSNLKAYLELLKEWRAMGGAQDYVVAQCHTLARKCFQEAAIRAFELPPAIPVAVELRARSRAVLREPDGYEIWAEY